MLVARDPDTAAGEPAFEDLGDVTIVRVPDTLRALHAVAAAWRARFSPLVVGVTGSIAKTSTKEAVAAVLEPLDHDPALRGQPEQRGRAAADHPASRPRARGRGAGDGHVRGWRDPRPRRDRTTVDRDRDRRAARPPLADREHRGDRGRQGRAGRGASGGRRRRGRDPQRRRRAGAAHGVSDAGAGADLRVRPRRRRDGRGHRLRGVRRDAVHGSGRRWASEARPSRRLASSRSTTPWPGPPPASRPAWTSTRSCPGLAAPSQAPHRSAIVRARGLTIVDDAYNASPGSMRAALDLLAGLPGRRVAVLGEMLELGDGARRRASRGRGGRGGGGGPAGRGRRRAPGGAAEIAGGALGRGHAQPTASSRAAPGPRRSPRPRPGSRPGRRRAGQGVPRDRARRARCAPVGGRSRGADRGAGGRAGRG